jgi:CDP-4-dehydro-6-deoxyglucose reductase, E3
MTSFVVKFEPANVDIPCEGDSTILDGALGAGFFPKHSCRRGECRACETRILSGEVRYAGESTPDNIKPGHCLTCLAIPATDVVLDAPEVSSVPGRRISKLGARVIAVERISEDVTIVRLQLPVETEFSFEPGQYVDVILRDGSRRSYSMANAPAESGQIEWHVRAMPGGRFSQHVYQHLKPRDLLRVEGPFGSFALRDTNAPMIFLASGTGYAPIASMMKSHRERIASRGATLYWGGRREADLYAIQEAEEWAKEFSAVSFVPVLSDPDDKWEGRRGLVHEAVRSDHADLSTFEVYACGNPLMIDAARRAFCDDCGLPEENFLSDSFVTILKQS